MDRENGDQPPRAEGCVILLYDHIWEDRFELDALGAPIPVDEWVAATRQLGYTVEWTPEAVLTVGPYRGGTVVEIVDERGRSYVAVPPEALDVLARLMAPEDYRMVREDIANIHNHEGHGATVILLDQTAWEQHGQIVPASEPIPSEAWATAIHRHHERVSPPTGALIPKNGIYPAGQVVAVDDANGRHYYAVPRAALALVDRLSLESESIALVRS